MTDLKTALSGMLVIVFILAGLDYIILSLSTSLSSFKTARHYGKAKHFFSIRNTYSKDSFEYQYYSLMYRKHLSDAVSGGGLSGKSRDFSFGSPDYFHPDSIEWDSDRLEDHSRFL
ncbi:hypothetical protein GF1_11940 [Desulfolithobacter dissulfuricans]|uniref:Uncharacterized protein n=1 Tax=Desulfolithobacter dissulfuricans TaxID=2795293 RepID=A0A915XK78_9BACT|nr:hypothetical protein [Desulfolithobacter dissulfuricans]BCO08818.1 hypothetical protein GF1_11940 [Desulfolithobacter dissulfuricans]